VARLKLFRALRYDTARAGPLETLVAPPHDVIGGEELERLRAASPWNIVHLIRPDAPEDAARALREWRASEILVRETSPAAWILEETFAGPDGLERTRRGVVARTRLEPYGAGDVVPHERTLASQKAARLDLLRATHTKLSSVLLLHEGDSPPAVDREPEIEVEFDGVISRLWRVEEPAELLEGVRGRAIIADGHHRYETSLRFHEEQGTEETAYVLSTLVARSDPGLVIFPTHRLALGPVPELNGRLRLTPLTGGASDALESLARVPRDRPAFVLLRPDDAVLAEAGPEDGPVAVLDTAILDELALPDVRFTASVEEAERAVRSGDAEAAFLVRAPTIAQVEAVALAGAKMPEKSTYFFPKLTSGLLLSPFDE